jgi:membrane-associated phospholipid phosphatase
MNHLKRQLRRLGSTALRHISALVSYEVYFLFILFAFVLDAIHLAGSLLLGVVLLYGFGIPLRLLIYSPRPQQEPLDSLLKSINTNSFPSFHMARGTILGILLSIMFQTVWFLALWSLMLLAIGTGRIITKRHYIIDLIGGVLLGIITTTLVMNLYFPLIHLV